jgi:hypothetical protein
MPVPENAKAIYGFLRAAGATPNAAAGILGNIEQESGGNPEAGANPPGKGLIQILGDPGGSLAEDLNKTLEYIRQNGSIKDINAHSSTPSQAALYFSTKYERPNPADANNANRIASANAVASAAKSGKWPGSSSITMGGGSGSNSSAPALGISGGISEGFDTIPGMGFLGNAISSITGVGQTVGDIATAIAGVSHDLDTMLHFMAALFRPQLWLRVGAFFVGLIALAGGLIMLGKSVGISGPSMPNVVPIPV